jgi:hypothetical protein
MLFLHEVHKVVGARAEEFEEAYRKGWMPTLAKGDDARLLWYTNHAVGSSVSYNVVTITAIKDGAAWERMALRVQKGDLRDWVNEVDSLRYDVFSKILLPVYWSRIQEVDFKTVPTDGREHDLALFMGRHRLAIFESRRLHQDVGRDLFAPDVAGATRDAHPRYPGVFPGGPRQLSASRGDAVAENCQLRRADAFADQRSSARASQAGRLHGRRAQIPRPMAEQAAAHHSLVSAFLRSREATDSYRGLERGHVATRPRAAPEAGGANPS